MQKGNLVRAASLPPGIGLVQKVEEDKCWVLWLSGHMKDLGKGDAMGPFPMWMLEVVSC